MLRGLRLFSWVVVVGVLLWPVMEGTASFQAAEGRTGEPVIIARLSPTGPLTTNSESVKAGQEAEIRLTSLPAGVLRLSVDGPGQLSETLVSTSGGTVNVT